MRCLAIVEIRVKDIGILIDIYQHKKISYYADKVQIDQIQL